MSDSLVALLLDATVRSIAAVGLIALGLAALRVRDSSLRHAAWAAATAAMLLMPVLARITPSLAVPVPAAIDAIAGAHDIPSTLDDATTTFSAPSTATLPVGPQVGRDMGPQALPGMSGGAGRRARWQTVVGVAYLLGAAFLLAQLVFGCHQLRRLSCSARPVCQRHLASKIGVADAEGTALFESAHVSSPLTLGFLRPRIVLPSVWHQWPAQKTRLAIAHERAHVARRDPLITLVAHVNRCVFWFHPLAWWLERAVTAAAEHACDDEAMRVAATPREYADVLLDFARSARRAGSRVAWEQTGMNGGRLGRRIDRVLRGQTFARGSAAYRTAVAASCVGAIVLAVSCRRQVAPLIEDPNVAANLARMFADIARTRADTDFSRQARAMSLQEAADLEAALDRNPEDEVTRRKLLIFYRWDGTNEQSWNDNVTARRRHALWLTEHHPESSLMELARVSRTEDPAGYEMIRQRWRSHVDRPGASVQVLFNAIRFFEVSDKPTAAQLSLQAKALYPDGLGQRRYPSWSHFLGTLYARAIAESIETANQQPGERFARDGNTARNREFLAVVRAELEKSKDPALLHAAGQHLAMEWMRVEELDDERLRLARHYFDRASSLDPQDHVAWELLQLERVERNIRELRRPSPLVKAPPASWSGILAAMPVEERLPALVTKAVDEYLRAELVDYAARHPEHSEYLRGAGPAPSTEAATASFERSKTYARQALDLASSMSSHSAYGEAVYQANLALALNAFRDGGVQTAVRHMLDASKAPPSADPGDRPFPGALEGRLTKYLLDYGERQSVVEYLERSFQDRQPAERERMLKEAAAIRAGRMPSRLQFSLARPDGWKE